MTTIDSHQDVMTLINIFNINPSRCDELVTALTDATTDTLAQFPGFVSANIHRSHDNATVINYAQWATRAEYDAMLNNPAAQPHLQEAADIADSFNPVIVTVVHSTTRP